MTLDNVRYHHTNKVTEFIEEHAANMKFKFLPTYSSDLNSIEHLWKDLRKDVTHNYDGFGGIAEVVQAIGKYFMKVKRNSCKIKRLSPLIY